MLLLVALGAAALPAVRTNLSPGEADYPSLELVKAERASFRISVTERGQIDSMNNAILSSQVEGTTTIISIVPEGKQVKAGQVVCELDSSDLVEQERQQQISLTQAEASLRKAEESLKIQEAQNESDVASATLTLDLARLDLDKFENGEFPQQVSELRGNVTVAEEELRRAREVYEFSKQSALKGYKSQNELQADRIAVTRTQISLAVAEETLSVLEDYTYRRTVQELKEMASEAIRELERVKRAGAASLAQFDAELAAARLTYEVQQGRLEQLRKQIASCKLVAPQDGEVVYANLDDDDDPIQEGTVVRERQAIIQLPDVTKMKVEARVHESRIGFVREGLPVTVHVDAYRGEKFRGVVHSVASVPSSGSRHNRDLREYVTVIRITDDVERVKRLRPGLTAEVEIQVDYRPQILQVPVQAVVTIGSGHVAYVLAPSGPERRDVRIGATNDRTVEILEGIEEGERVVANPRASFSSELELLEAEARKEALQSLIDSQAADEAGQ